MRQLISFLAVWVPLSLFSARFAIAQTITPAADGTGTIVTPNGDQFNITGGTRAGDNLFQSFQRFGLNPNQAANFIADPSLRNILGRVVGGDPSVINGLIQVTGGSPNLYLMNPAGIIFGPSAILNVPADFTATTATGIGFGSNQFSAVGTNNYANLVGDPTSFAFSLSRSGALVNAGKLSVAEGQSLNLVGGTIVNTGTLSAPGGSITVVAVPGTSRIRLSQPGSLLSLEVDRNALSETGAPAATLPELITGTGSNQATALTVEPDGTVRLANVVVPDAAGTSLISGTVNVSSPTGSGGVVQVLGDTVGLLGAQVEASGGTGGGTVLIGGDYKGQGSVPNAQLTVVDAGSTLRANAGQVGNGGRVILWADELTSFTGSIRARGGTLSGSGGFVEVSGKQNLQFSGQVDLSAPNGQVGALLLDPENILISANPSTGGVDNQFQTLTPGQILRGDFPGQNIVLNANVLTSQTAAITLEARQDIRLDGGLSLNFVPGGAIVFRADADQNGTGTFQMPLNSAINAPGREISIFGAELILSRIDTSTSSGGGRIILSAQRDISVSRLLDSSATSGNGGIISLTSNTGQINTQASDLRSGATSGNGGNITLIAQDDIITGGLDASTASGNGGIITLQSSQGQIDTRSGTLNTRTNSGGAGDVFLTAQQGVRVGDIITRTTSGVGGDINITSFLGPIDTRAGTLQTSGSGNAGIAGNVLLQVTNPGGRVVVDALEALGSVGSGNITVIGDAIDFEGGNNSIQSRGTLTIRSITPTLGIRLGDTNSSGQLDIERNELNALANGFAEIIIASPNHAGPIILLDSTLPGGASPFRDPVLIAGGSQLIGPNQSTTWTLTGPNEGNLNTIYSAGLRFENIGNLQGGQGDDTFVFQDGAGVTGLLNGGGGFNQLDYRAYTTPVAIDLQLGTATGTGGIANIGNAILPGSNPNPGPSPDPVPGPSPSPDPAPSPEPNPDNPQNPTPSPTPGPDSGDQPDPDANLPEGVSVDLTRNTQNQDSDSQSTLDDFNMRRVMQRLEESLTIEQIERNLTQDYERYLGLTSPLTPQLENIQTALRQIEAAHKIRPAIIYAVFPSEGDGQERPSLDFAESGAYLQPGSMDDPLVLILVTSRRYTVVPVNTDRQAVFQVARRFRVRAEDPYDLKGYLEPAQQLYQWLLAPLEQKLQAEGIDNLTYITDLGLKTTTLAALHDGNAFIVHRYSLGIMPSFGLTQTKPRNLVDSNILAMGISEFADKAPLPAVQTELDAIQALWQQPVRLYLNQTFTMDALKARRSLQQSYTIVHLATHSEFNPGEIKQSYIQLWDTQLRLDQLSKLGLDQPPVDLLVLSACRTAIGSFQAELGFTGAAVQVGVQSVLGSLWYVSDLATLALMSEFYTQLAQGHPLSDALRLAQIAMIEGKVRVENGQLITSQHSFPLPPPFDQVHSENFQHPYYWSAFVLVGNPW